MPRKKNNSSEKVQVQAQKQPTIKQMDIHALWLDRERYQYKDTQRGNVWKPYYKKALIDSILQGLPIPALLLRNETDANGKQTSWVIDGRQRLTSIFEFRNNGFKTATIGMSHKIEPNSIPPIEPGRNYEQLSQHSKNMFDNYVLLLNVLDDDEDKEGLIFRRWQNHVPLTSAEMLASYQSETRELAVSLQNHSIWGEIYEGKDPKRKQLFQGALCLVILELTDGRASLTPGHLKEYASGYRDEDITNDLLERLFERLDVVQHVFTDTKITHWAEIIPMYQAVLFLNQKGRTFTTSDIGCLTPWFANIQVEALEERRKGFASPLVKLINTNMQNEFWEENMGDLLAQCQEKTSEVA